MMARTNRTRDGLVTTHRNGAPLALGTLRHNAYIYGFEDGVTDDFDWPDYGHGKRVGGQDYLDGFEAGRAARAIVFEEARARKAKTSPSGNREGD